MSNISQFDLTLLVQIQGLSLLQQIVNQVFESLIKSLNTGEDNQCSQHHEVLKNIFLVYDVY
jgi:hypothetical protein